MGNKETEESSWKRLWMTFSYRRGADIEETFGYSSWLSCGPVKRESAAGPHLLYSYNRFLDDIKYENLENQEPIQDRIWR
jgi:hypothetical protein